MIKKLGVVALGALLLMPLLASAHHAGVRDGNDARGRLDIKWVAVTKGKPPKWKIRTWQGWNVGELWDRGFVVVFLDTFGGPRGDYYAIVSSNGRRMVGALYLDRESRRDFRIHWLRAAHPGRNLVNVTIPLKKVRRRSTNVYRWNVGTMFGSRRCRRLCFDRAPNNGWVSEPGPAPTPTATLPTPMPTLPTPTPTP